MKLDRNGYAPSIMQADKTCFLTGADDEILCRHEIFFGTAHRRVSKANGFWIYVLPRLHNVDDGCIHRNQKLDLELKQLCQKKYEETHSRAEFIELIGKNYLEGDQ